MTTRHTPRATIPHSEREMEKAMGPDYSREGMFIRHNYSSCQDGEKPCVQGGPHRCEFPQARND